MSTIIQKTEIEDQFQISPNPKFDVLPHKGITLLENTAVATKYAKVQEILNGAQTMNLTYQVGETLFLDRGVFLEVDVPVTLTPTTAFGTVPTSSTYLAAANHFKEVAFRQYGILSCVDQLTVAFNNATVSSISNLQRSFEMTSEYYNGALVEKFFPASMPDRFVSLESYDSSGPLTVETLDEDGNIISMAIPALAEDNIFTGGYSNKYNSRRPAFRFVSATLSQLNLMVKCYMYLPFTFFATPDAETSLYGINQLNVQLTMLDNWIKRLFVKRGIKWSSIDFDSNNQGKHIVTMHLKTYQAPDYVRAAMMDKNGMPKPYRLAYNRVIAQPPKKLTDVSALKTGNTAISDQISLGSLPKHIYIGIHPLTTLGGLFAPNFKGRINSIEATVGNTTTIIGKSALVIFNLSKGNGLSKTFEESMFTNGFVVKLDVAKDLGVGGHLIGANIPTTIQFTVIFDSLDSALVSRPYELRIVTTAPGQLVYDNREFKLLTSLVLSNAPYDITNQAAALYGQLSPKIMTIGAGVFGDIWNGIKKAGRAGIKWIRENPDQVASLLGKGIRALAGGANVPYQQNTIGGSQTLLLGAGNVNQNPFK